MIRFVKESKISKREFLNLATNEITKITKQMGKPNVGVFVPDGNRRMTLVFSGLDPQTDTFYYENARMTTEYFMDNLKIFFSHGLETLFIPLISGNVLERNQKYMQITLKEGLQKIFKDQKWVNFYKENDIRVHIYGDLDRLVEKNCSQVHGWIDHVNLLTSKYKSKHLFYGFLSPKRYGNELAHLSIDFYKKYGRDPTYQEQVRLYYGQHVNPADFFIMSTKFAGLGALPPLICGQETQLYFLPAPGVMALTQDTYREILYDLLFCRPNSTNNKFANNWLQDLTLLKDYYLRHRTTVIGLGKRIGKFWVPNV